jgi:selenocysteine-specific elongation factor
MADRDLVIGTAGHIDHGKTALVRALTGVDTDRLPAEKQRGITIDLGFAALDLGGVRLALVDVPGHERFIRNMLAGATGLDLALLVVAADDSVMPQTREHLEILRLLGLSGGVVALTKCDLADPSWLALVEDDVKELVAGTFLEGAPVVRTSATTGEGIGALQSALKALGETAPARDDPGLFRLAIDRAFTVAGHGTVVTGTVASGGVAVGDELAWLPEGRPVRVRGLQRHDRPVERVGRGARAAVNLVGVHHAEVSRGQELAAPGYLEATRAVSAEVRCSADAPRPLRHRGRYRLHLGTAEVTATLALLGADELRPGASALGQLFLAGPVTAVSGQPFVLREESPPATLGGGRVLEPSARRVRRRDAAAVTRLDRLRAPDPVVRASAALAGFGLRPWSDRALCREAGLAAAEVGPVLAALAGSSALVELPVGPRRTTRVLAEVVGRLEDRTLRALARLHEARPRQSAIPRAHVAAALPDLGNDALVAAPIDRLKARGQVAADARTVALKGFEPRLSQGERRLKSELAEALRAGGFSPPELADLVATAGARGPVVAELMALLRDEERAVEITPQLYLDFEAAARLRRLVTERLSGGAAMTMAELRDLLGTTRKYAVPIGEYLDRIGLTLRDGDVRRLNPAFESTRGAPA